MKATINLDQTQRPWPQDVPYLRRTWNPQPQLRGMGWMAGPASEPGTHAMGNIVFDPQTNTFVDVATGQPVLGPPSPVSQPAGSNLAGGGYASAGGSTGKFLLIGAAIVGAAILFTRRP
jgi:hypothetical protein